MEGTDRDIGAVRKLKFLNASGRGIADLAMEARPFGEMQGRRVACGLHWPRT
jgi:hypothetical protein